MYGLCQELDAYGRNALAEVNFIEISKKQIVKRLPAVHWIVTDGCRKFFKCKGKWKFMSYQLITDATADFSPDMLNEIPELDIIPMEVILDGESRRYSPGPGGELSVEEFYQALRQGKYGSTSQINPNTYMECFERYLKQGKDILYLCFSSGLSATYQNACSCAEELEEKYPERSVRCIDTLAASGGQALLVYETAKKWQSGILLWEEQ